MKKHLYSFISCNLLMSIVGVGFWQLGLVEGLNTLPKSEYIMMGFLTFQWCIGLGFILSKKWQSVYHIANTLPMWGLVCLSLNVFDVIHSAATISPEVAFGIVKGAGLALLINAFGVFLMVWLKALAFFCGDEHV